MKAQFAAMGLLLLCTMLCIGQQNGFDKADDTQIRLKKQILVSDLERQIKDIPFAAVRVWARYNIAAWLWKDGRDDSERAEDIAVAALDDYYQNRELIPPQYSYRSKLFGLLDAHAKDTGKRLREKYNVSPQADLEMAYDLLGKNGGDKLAVDIGIRVLSLQNATGPDMAALLISLSKRDSLELNRLAAAILAAEAAGRIKLTINNIQSYTDYFNRADTPIEIRKQFLNVALAKCGNVAALGPIDHMQCYSTFQRIVPDLSAKAPEILAEAGPVLTLLRAQYGQRLNEVNDSYARRKDSPTRLSETVSEAEAEEDPIRKYSLYRSVANIALSEKKFQYAVDLMVKASEIELPKRSVSAASAGRLLDQFYEDVVTQSLAAKEPQGANYAIRRMNDPLSKGESLGDLAHYYLNDNDLDSAFRYHDEAIKTIGRADNTPLGIGLLSKMLPTAHRLDQARMYELNKLIAKGINALPSLDSEDKPGTQKYRDHVVSIMVVHYHLLPALRELVKVNRSAVMDLTDLVTRKEIKIGVELVLQTNLIDAMRKQESDSKVAGRRLP